MEMSLTEALEGSSFLSEDEDESVTSVINSWRKFCLGPILDAANLLDPRFRGRILTEEETVAAEDKILTVANMEDIPADEVAADLLEYIELDLAPYSARQGSYGISRITQILSRGERLYRFSTFVKSGSDSAFDVSNIGSC